MYVKEILSGRIYLYSISSQPQIVEEFRGRRDARNEQAISRPGAGDVEQVALRVVDLFEIRVVGRRLDPFLKGNDLVVAGHHGDRPKLQPLGQRHRADRDAAVGRLPVLVEDH